MRGRSDLELEFIFLSNIYKDSYPVKTITAAELIKKDNLPFYKEQVNMVGIYHDEKLKYHALLNLPEFSVQCIDNQADTELLEVFHQANAEWLKLGEQYIVYKAIRDDLGGLTFKLKTKEGKEIKTPHPYVGFSSVRFASIDYAALN